MEHTYIHILPKNSPEYESRLLAFQVGFSGLGEGMESMKKQAETMNKEKKKTEMEKKLVGVDPEEGMKMLDAISKSDAALKVMAEAFEGDIQNDIHRMTDMVQALSVIDNKLNDLGADARKNVMNKLNVLFVSLDLKVNTQIKEGKLVLKLDDLSETEKKEKKEEAAHKNVQSQVQRMEQKINGLEPNWTDLISSVKELGDTMKREEMNDNYRAGIILRLNRAAMPKGYKVTLTGDSSVVMEAMTDEEKKRADAIGKKITSIADALKGVTKPTTSAPEQSEMMKEFSKFVPDLIAELNTDKDGKGPLEKLNYLFGKSTTDRPAMLESLRTALKNNPKTKDYIVRETAGLLEIAPLQAATPGTRGASPEQGREVDPKTWVGMLIEFFRELKKLLADPDFQSTWEKLTGSSAREQNLRNEVSTLRGKLTAKKDNLKKLEEELKKTKADDAEARQKLQSQIDTLKADIKKGEDQLKVEQQKREAAEKKVNQIKEQLSKLGYTATFEGDKITLKAKPGTSPAQLANTLRTAEVPYTVPAAGLLTININNSNFLNWISGSNNTLKAKQKLSGAAPVVPPTLDEPPVISGLDEPPATPELDVPPAAPQLDEPPAPPALDAPPAPPKLDEPPAPAKLDPPPAPPTLDPPPGFTPPKPTGSGPSDTVTRAD